MNKTPLYHGVLHTIQIQQSPYAGAGYTVNQATQCSLLS